MMKNAECSLKFEQSGTETDTKYTAMDNGALDHENHQDNLPVEVKIYTEDDPPKVSEKAKQLIETILEQLKELSNTEKYLLYLKLFQKSNVVDPLRQPLNPLGSRSEINRTISWIKTHLEEDQETSLPKQQVYEEYSSFCCQNEIKSLSQADFGKVMKQVYPKVRPRRLGTRGNSRYCYSGLRRCLKLKPPKLPDLTDKPLSTETPCTESNLTAAAWLIVKEWSESHFHVPFQSLLALARFLVVNHAIGIGSVAATQLTTSNDTTTIQCTRPDMALGNNKGGTKHREMQLQLQKKIQQKHDIKERKRKTPQSPKCEPKKRSKPSTSSSSTATTPTNTSTTSSPDGNNFESSSSTNTGGAISPTQGTPICDKSFDFTQLPDFNSFQKPPLENNNYGTTGKVAIPRIKTPLQQQQRIMNPVLKQQQNLQQQAGMSTTTTKTTGAAAKYKAIQPKPPQQRCDNVTYNCPNQQQQRHTQTNVDVVTDINHRSQQASDEGALLRPPHFIDRITIKERKSSDEEDECDTTTEVPPPPQTQTNDDGETFPITRERLESISSVDKDAMDEYLGTNNSQHEEELSKYFADEHPDNNTPSATSTTATNNSAISTTSNPPPPIVPINPTPTPTTISKLSQLRQLLEQNSLTIYPLTIPPYVLPPAAATISVLPSMKSQSAHSTTRRRVSFETMPMVDDSSALSLATTVPPSPNTRRKNFSFTPISPGPQSPNSPFVSPRQTPVPRTKTTNLRVEIPERKRPYTMAASAPTSPMYPGNNNNNSQSMLEKLLHSNSKVTYTPDYNAPIVDSSCEFVRSQSVPLSQMIKSNLGASTVDEYVAPSTAGDFNDFDPIAGEETDTVNNIIEALDKQQNLYSSVLPSFELIANNERPPPNFGVFTQCSRTLGRSQSIDVNGCYEMKCSMNPSRSVPSTPLSFNLTNHNNNNTSKMRQQMAPSQSASRSYPSTPALMTATAFNYSTTNSDCLLNGQPIRMSNGNGGSGGDEVGVAKQGLYFMTNLSEGIEEEFRTLAPVVVAGNEFGMDEHGVLIGEQNFNNVHIQN